MIKHGIVHILAPIWIRIHFFKRSNLFKTFFAICIKYRNKHINCLISFQLTKNVCNPTTHPHGFFFWTQFNKLLHLCWIICCLGFCRFNVILFIYFLFGVFNFYRFFVLFDVEFFRTKCLFVSTCFFVEFFLLLFQIPCSILNLECH